MRVSALVRRSGKDMSDRRAGFLRLFNGPFVPAINNAHDEEAIDRKRQAEKDKRQQHTDQHRKHLIPGLTLFAFQSVVLSRKIQANRGFGDVF
jgi:hypothetical protein